MHVALKLSIYKQGYEELQEELASFLHFSELPYRDPDPDVFPRMRMRIEWLG